MLLLLCSVSLCAKTFLLNAKSSCFVFLLVVFCFLFFVFFFFFSVLFCKDFYLHFTCFCFFSLAVCSFLWQCCCELHLNGSCILYVAFSLFIVVVLTFVLHSIFYNFRTSKPYFLLLLFFLIVCHIFSKQETCNFFISLAATDNKFPKVHKL